MEKGIVILIVVIILASVIGGSLYYVYYIYTPNDDSKKDGDNTPEIKNRKPVAFFKGNNSGIVGQVLYFDANGSKDYDGYIVSYTWKYGDGSDDYFINTTLANHTYHVPGNYVINLTVRDNHGASDSYSQDITIRPQDYEKSESTILLERMGLDTLNETIPIDIFVVSLWVNISFVGASSNGFQIGDAALEVTIMDPLGIVIANETKETRLRNAYIDFFFDDPDILIPGQFEMEAKCLDGSLYLSYEIVVRY